VRRPIFVQRAAVREHCATRISTVYRADVRPSRALTMERLADLRSSDVPTGSRTLATSRSVQKFAKANRIRRMEYSIGYVCGGVSKSLITGPNMRQERKNRKLFRTKGVFLCGSCNSQLTANLQMSSNSTRSPRKYSERNKTSHGGNERHPYAHRRERSRDAGGAVSRFSRIMVFVAPSVACARRSWIPCDRARYARLSRGTPRFCGPIAFAA
jgi:hypothetical protein